MAYRLVHQRTCLSSFIDPGATNNINLHDVITAIIFSYDAHIAPAVALIACATPAAHIASALTTTAALNTAIEPEFDDEILQQLLML